MVIASHPPTAESTTGKTTPRIHLRYLDGIRALAALYVSFFHATLNATWTGVYGDFPAGLSAGAAHVMGLFMFGRFAVGVFIVLSGYCLMIPVARQGDGWLPGGPLAFLRRRARRILPPYYAAMGLSLLLALLPWLSTPAGTRWDQALPAWSRGAIVSHLLLIHNWRPDWFFRIDMPLWSVATEWQIYWLFPLLLLPLCRRFGPAAVVVVPLCLATAVHFWFGGRLDYLCPWYVGLFGMGMVGALFNFSPAPWAKRWREALPWGLLSAVSWGAVAVLALITRREWMDTHAWLTDPALGVAVMFLIVFCTRASAERSLGRRPAVLRLLETPWLVTVGVFSYSYYLIHDPLLALVNMALRHSSLMTALTPLAVWLVTLGVGLPFCLACAYGFHVVFERPFLPGRPQTPTQIAETVAVSPAP